MPFSGTTLLWDSLAWGIFLNDLSFVKQNSGWASVYWDSFLGCSFLTFWQKERKKNLEKEEVICQHHKGTRMSFIAPRHWHSVLFVAVQLLKEIIIVLLPFGLLTASAAEELWLVESPRMVPKSDEWPLPKLFLYGIQRYPEVPLYTLNP